MDKKTVDDVIQDYRGCHVLVYFGDGRGRPEELILSTGNSYESDQVCDLVTKILQSRRKA